MADYRDHYEEIRAAGASLVAIAVDAAERSEPMRIRLGLPFPILCDTEWRVVKEWGVFNAEEKGGIAVPSVFIVDRNRVIVFAEIDRVEMRTPAAGIIDRLRNPVVSERIRRKVIFPRVSDWVSGIRYLFRR